MLHQNFLRLEQNPEAFPVIRHLNFDIRRCVITKHNSIIYLIKDGSIYIIDVFDTRQHPDNLNLKGK